MLVDFMQEYPTDPSKMCNKSLQSLKNREYYLYFWRKMEIFGKNAFKWQISNEALGQLQRSFLIPENFPETNPEIVFTYEKYSEKFISDIETSQFIAFHGVNSVFEMKK